jgi:thiol-disulfide isomerase/thioredoxin
MVLVAIWAGDGVRAAPPPAPTTPDSTQLLEELGKTGAGLARATDPQEVAYHTLHQADLLALLAGQAKPDERGQWLRQLIDCLSSAALNCPTAAAEARDRLKRVADHLASTTPGSDPAAYAAYRSLQAEQFAGAGRTPEQWRDRLAAFVRAYPQAEHTPEALFELGTVSELLGKDEDARGWYQTLIQRHPDHPLAPKAAGAVRRLGLDGQVLYLALPRLDSLQTVFDVDRLRGRVVLVHFWAGWDGRCVDDFARLRVLLQQHAARGLELVGVNLDPTPEEGLAQRAALDAPGTHVYQQGGLEGRIATRYGLAVLPTFFLVGRDGKVVRRATSLGELEEEIRKLCAGTE